MNEHWPIRGFKWRPWLKSRRDHWSYARAYMVRAGETDNEKRRQMLLEMAGAWIELGLEEGLGGARNRPLTDWRGSSIGLIAANIRATIISVVKSLGTKLSSRFSLILAKLK